MVRKEHTIVPAWLVSSLIVGATGGCAVGSAIGGANNDPAIIAGSILGAGALITMAYRKHE